MNGFTFLSSVKPAVKSINGAVFIKMASAYLNTNQDFQEHW
jgi:hypothetical protein